MKKLIAIIFICGVGFSASAQHSKGSHRNVRSHVSIGIGGHSHYGYGYSRFYSPFNTYPYQSYGYNRPSQLDLDIQDINNDYRDRISSARQDKSLTRQQRKEIIRSLKYEREKAIIDARRNYYKRRY